MVAVFREADLCAKMVLHSEQAEEILSQCVSSTYYCLVCVDVVECS